MVQITLDTMHWNRMYSTEEPVVAPPDLGPDVEWAMNALDDDEKAA